MYTYATAPQRVFDYFEVSEWINKYIIEARLKNAPLISTYLSQFNLFSRFKPPVEEVVAEADMCKVLLRVLLRLGESFLC